MSRVSLEKKIADSLANAASDFRFSPVVFGIAVSYLPYPVQQRIGALVFAIMDALADRYVNGLFDIQNRTTVEACYHAREAIRLQFQQFPPIV